MMTWLLAEAVAAWHSVTVLVLPVPLPTDTDEMVVARSGFSRAPVPAGMVVVASTARLSETVHALASAGEPGSVEGLASTAATAFETPVTLALLFTLPVKPN